MKASNFKPSMSRSDSLFLINLAINVPLMLVATMGNALILAAISKTPSLRTPSILLLGSLAVSDLLVGVVVQPLYITSGLVTSLPLDSIWFVLTFAMCGISLCSITAISVDRLLALHYHLRYPTIVTASRIKITLVLMWIAILLLSGVYFWSRDAYFLIIALGVFLCLTISTCSYIRIFTIVRRQQRQIQCQRQAITSLNENSRIISNMQQLKKSAMNSFLFFIVIVLFYLPMSTFLSLYLLEKNWQKGWSFATTLVFMNSSINPFLYCWRMRGLRASVVKTARKLFCKQ